jgi:hypothetical protein
LTVALYRRWHSFLFENAIRVRTLTVIQQASGLFAIPAINASAKKASVAGMVPICPIVANPDPQNSNAAPIAFHQPAKKCY